MTPKTLKFETHEEWLALRNTGIGGSDVGAILGLNSYTTPLDVFLRKTGVVEPDDISEKDAVWLGNVLEEPLAKWAAEHLGIRVRRRNSVLQHPDHPFMLASLDFEVVGKPWIIECKTAGLASGYFDATEWGEPGTDEVPRTYLLQGMHYLAITGKERVIYPVVVAGRGRCIYYVDRDEELIQLLIDRETVFWSRVQDGTPPAPTTNADVLHMHPADDGTKTEATADDANLVEAVRIVKGNIKEQRSKLGSLEMQLKERIGDHALLVDADGKKLASWKSQTSRRFDTKAFAEDHPETYEQYRRESVSRVLRVS